MGRTSVAESLRHGLTLCLERPQRTCWLSDKNGVTKPVPLVPETGRQWPANSRWQFGGGSNGRTGRCMDRVDGLR